MDSNHINPGKLWTVWDVAKAADTSKDTVTRAIHEGAIQAQRVGRVFAIPESEALAWLESRQRSVGAS